MNQIDFINFKGKRALVRVDFNVPLDKETYEITDDTRIRAALPTIKKILQDGGAVVLMSHLGRPLKKLNDDGSINHEKFTLKHIVKRLSELLNTDVQFANDCIGSEVLAQAQSLTSGQVLLVENTRFHKGEEKGEEAFAQALSQLGDIYINDAFGTAHRAHASTTIVAKYFDADHKAFGYLMNAEVANAEKVIHQPEKPFTAIIGGAKVSDKILIIENLLEIANNIIIGGGMSYTFLKAQGIAIGNSLCEDDKLDIALKVLQKAKDKNVNLYIPVDHIIADKFDAAAQTQITSVNNTPEGWMGLDIGPETIKLYTSVINASKTILWNGPMGVFEMEAFQKGTKSVALAVAEATQNGAFSLVGGGDSVAAVNLFQLGDKVSFVSTGGGAMLEFFEGKILPGVAAIQQ
ncbi:MAG: phosphoglycerate kinase [Chitinophagales bacterium]|nr:phosphoglycerate kinase [Chitinophagales bacterium]